VARYQPDAAAVEIIFVNVNPQSTLLLGQARGACVTSLVNSNLSVAEYTALQMKKAVAGHGKAGQGAGAGDGQAPARPAGLPGADAADALGIAITHAHVGSSMARLAQASGAVEDPCRQLPARAFALKAGRARRRARRSAPRRSRRPRAAST
jgi:crossover junction endodeoxyribonuclease RuvC